MLKFVERISQLREPKRPETIRPCIKLGEYMDCQRREFCAFITGGFALLSGCAAADDIANEAAERADSDTRQTSKSKSDSTLYHESQQIPLQAGQVHGETFESTGSNRLEFTVDGLSYYPPGFICVFAYEEWKDFQSRLNSTGKWDGGVPLYDSLIVPGPQKVDLIDDDTYVIALGLKQEAGISGEQTPSPVTASLEYWIYN